MKTLLTILSLTVLAVILPINVLAQWAQMNPSTSPDGRHHHSCAYLGDGKIVLYGGWDGSPMGDLWIYDYYKNTWTERTTQDTPAELYHLSLSYIAENKVLLFGGYNSGGAGNYDNTWIYDYSENTWTEMFPSSPPTSRRCYRLAYAGSDQVLLFGGVTSDYVNDTWIYDLSDDTWTQKSPGTSPASRSDHAMSYIGDDKIIMFGGCSSSYYNDTWIYDVSDNTWTQMFPGTSPCTRNQISLAYLGGDKVLLFGGYNGLALGDTWEYDLSDNAWTQISPSSSPSSRYTYYSCPVSENQVMLFGGNDGGYDAETWVYSYLPIIPTTDTPTAITTSSAVSGANILGEGSSTISSRGVCHNASGSPTIADDKTIDGSGTGSYTSSITGLLANNMYYVRAYATNSSGTGYGDVKKFITDKFISGVYYTGTARNASGSLLKDQYAGVKCEIRKRSNDDLVFQETHSLAVNSYGTYSFELGTGEVTIGGMDLIDVSNYNYYVLVFLDDSAPYSSYNLVESKDFLAMVRESASISIANAGSTSSGSTYASGELKSFYTLEERNGWTYTGQAECIGTPDTWTEMSLVNAAPERAGAPMIWTGDQMIIWGGRDSGGDALSDGYLYNPDDNVWTVMNTTSAPAARHSHTMVWTGTELIIWGGFDTDDNVLGSGYKYNPETEIWTEISSTNAPEARSDHECVWTGKEMIVWGGFNDSEELNSGAKYNPATDTWTTMTTDNALSPRIAFSMVWTGSQVIMWGGNYQNVYYNDGSMYNPDTDTWTTMSTTSAPTERCYSGAVWTGDLFIVWGGQEDGTSELGDGAIYDPDTDTWTAITNTNAPTSRAKPAVVWAGEEMLLFGGTYHSAGWVNRGDGSRYNPATDTWTDLPTTDQPSPRSDAPNAWTGNRWIVWGAFNSVRDEGSVLSGGQTLYWYKKD